MNLRSITHVKQSIEAGARKKHTAFSALTGLICAGVFGVSLSVHAWEIDFSRRRKETKTVEPGAANSEKAAASSGFLDSILVRSIPQADIVVANTEKGFVPKQLHLRAGTKYNIHVVNINEKERNVSFVMDAFSQFGSTYYGQIKTFVVEPKKEGIFSFQCPETSIEGRIVVTGDATPMRQPAEESKP